MEALVALLLFVIVFGLLYWAVLMLPLPAPFSTAAQAILIIIGVVLLLGVLFGSVSIPSVRFR